MEHSSGNESRSHEQVRFHLLICCHLYVAINHLVMDEVLPAKIVMIITLHYKIVTIK